MYSDQRNLKLHGNKRPFSL